MNIWSQKESVGLARSETHVIKQIVQPLTVQAVGVNDVGMTKLYDYDNWSPE